MDQTAKDLGLNRPVIYKRFQAASKNLGRLLFVSGENGMVLKEVGRRFYV
jgi:DNA-binding transcriptional LysR family regulator